MLRSRFLWKLYAGYVALILVSTSLVGLLIARQIEQDTLSKIRESLRARAAFLRDAALPSLGERPGLALQARVRSLGAEIHTRLTIIRQDGTVLANSEEDPSRMDDHSNRPEILAAGSQDFGTAIRFSNTVGTTMMYVALPVRSDDRLLGFVRASLPLSAIDERLAHLRAVASLGAGVAIFVALILGFFMARAFAAPLSSMTAVAESMSRGNYDQQLPDRALGKKVWEVSRVPELRESLFATLESGEETRRELRLVARPRDRVLEMHTSPLRNGEGQVVGAVAVLHDVTELNHLETVRRDFVGNVSHELKTPITAIRGLIETLTDDEKMDLETRDRFLGKIADQSLRLSIARHRSPGPLQAGSRGRRAGVGSHGPARSRPDGRTITPPCSRGTRHYRRGGDSRRPDRGPWRRRSAPSGRDEPVRQRPQVHSSWRTSLAPPPRRGPARRP